MKLEDVTAEVAIKAFGEACTLVYIGACEKTEGKLSVQETHEIGLAAIHAFGNAAENIAQSGAPELIMSKVNNAESETSSS